MKGCKKELELIGFVSKHEVHLVKCGEQYYGCCIYCKECVEKDK